MRQTRKVSRAGVELIKSFEGLRTQAAQLPDGRFTMGYGHTFSAREGSRVTPEDAESLLRFDLLPIMDAINNAVHYPLNQNQFDALVSFSFNIGIDNFQKSLVLRRLNEGNLDEAANAMDSWRTAEYNGQTYVLAPLIRRRAAEKNLFLTQEDPASPSVPAFGFDVAQEAPLPVIDHIPLMDEFPSHALPSAQKPQSESALSPAHLKTLMELTGNTSLHQATPAPVVPFSAPAQPELPQTPPHAMAAPHAPSGFVPYAPPSGFGHASAPHAYEPEPAPAPSASPSGDQLFAALRQAEALEARRAEELKKLQESLERERQLRAEIERLEQEREALTKGASVAASPASYTPPHLAPVSQAFAQPSQAPASPLPHSHNPYAAPNSFDQAYLTPQSAYQPPHATSAPVMAPVLAPVMAPVMTPDLAYLEAQKLDMARQEALRYEMERNAAIEREAQRLEAQRLEAQRLEAQRLEAQRLEAQRLEAQRLEAQRLEAQHLEAQRLEAQRLEAQRLEAQRLEAQRLEAQRLEAQRLEAQRLEDERLEAQRLEQEKREAERLEREKLQRQEEEKQKNALLDDAHAQSEAQRKAEAAAALMRFYSPYGAPVASPAKKIDPITPSDGDIKRPFEQSAPSSEPAQNATVRTSDALPVIDQAEAIRNAFAHVNNEPEPQTHAASPVQTAKPSPKSVIEQELEFDYTPPMGSPSNLPPPIITAINPYSADKQPLTVQAKIEPSDENSSKPISDKNLDVPKASYVDDNLHWRERLGRPVSAVETFDDKNSTAQVLPELTNDFSLVSAPQGAAIASKNVNDFVLSNEKLMVEDNNWLKSIIETMQWILLSGIGIASIGAAIAAFLKSRDPVVIANGDMLQDFMVLAVLTAGVGLIFVVVSIFIILKRLKRLRESQA